MFYFSSGGGLFLMINLQEILWSLKTFFLTYYMYHSMTSNYSSFQLSHETTVHKLGQHVWIENSVVLNIRLLPTLPFVVYGGPRPSLPFLCPWLTIWNEKKKKCSFLNHHHWGTLWNFLVTIPALRKKAIFVTLSLAKEFNSV